MNGYQFGLARQIQNGRHIVMPLLDVGSCDRLVSINRVTINLMKCVIICSNDVVVFIILYVERWEIGLQNALHNTSNIRPKLYQQGTLIIFLAGVNL